MVGEEVGAGDRKGRNGRVMMVLNREGKKARMKIARKRMLVVVEVEEGINVRW